MMALAGGEMFPPDLLPGWLLALSSLSPFTKILVVSRAALLEGASWSGSFPRLAALVLQALAFTALGLWALTLGLRHARRTGGLAQYRRARDRRHCRGHARRAT